MQTAGFRVQMEAASLNGDGTLAFLMPC